jgi:hypothetical protein
MYISRDTRELDRFHSNRDGQCVYDDDFVVDIEGMGVDVGSIVQHGICVWLTCYVLQWQKGAVGFLVRLSLRREEAAGGGDG